MFLPAMPVPTWAQGCTHSRARGHEEAHGQERFIIFCSMGMNWDKIASLSEFPCVCCKSVSHPHSVGDGGHINANLEISVVPEVSAIPSEEQPELMTGKQADKDPRWAWTQRKSNGVGVGEEFC